MCSSLLLLGSFRFFLWSICIAGHIYIFLRACFVTFCQACVHGGVRSQWCGGMNRFMMQSREREETYIYFRPAKSIHPLLVHLGFFGGLIRYSGLWLDREQSKNEFEILIRTRFRFQFAFFAISSGQKVNHRVWAVKSGGPGCTVEFELLLEILSHTNIHTPTH